MSPSGRRCANAQGSVPSPDHRETQGCASLFDFARMMAQQWELGPQGFSRVIRSYHLMTRLDKLHGGVTKYLEKIFNCEPHVALGAAYGIFAMLNAGARNSPRAPGRLNLTSSSVTPEVVEKYGYDIDVAKVVATRLSTETHLFRAWHNEVLRSDNLLRQFCPHPFTQHPLLLVDETFGPDIGTGIHYLSPSAALVVSRMDSMFMSALIDNHPEHRVLRVKYGNALSSYLADAMTFAIGKSKVISIDDDLPHNLDTRADYVFLGEIARLSLSAKLAY